MYKDYFLSTIITVFCLNISHGQSYKLQDIETLFLQNNYSLLAKKFEISQSEALLVQEKLLPNPTLTVDEVNLWKNSSSEQLPYLFGRYGKTQQVSVAIEQLIETAGKRKKRVAIKQSEVKQTSFEYEELLRELKRELRLSYWNLYKINQTQKQTETLLELYSQLHEQYNRQAKLQNVSQVDAYRIQTALLNLQSENSELLQEQAQLLVNLQQLTQNPNLQLQQIHFDDLAFNLSSQLPIDLLDKVKFNNIALKQQENQLQLAYQQLNLEEAEKIPDLKLLINYDRGGNIMRDFVGIGINIDLPIFNQNKGNINAAKNAIDIKKNEQKALENQIETETNLAVNQILYFESLLKQRNDFQQVNRAQLLKNFHKHLNSKQITLLEFIDFTQAHLEAEKAYNKWIFDYYTNYEQLQYLLGKDF